MSADQRPSTRRTSASSAAKKSPTPAAQQQQQQQSQQSTSPTPLHAKTAQMPNDRLTAPLPSASLPSPPRKESWDDRGPIASSSSSSSSSRRSTLGGASAHVNRPVQEHATYDSTSNSIYAYQPHHHQHTAAAAAAAAAAQLQAAATFGVASSNATSPTHSFVPSPNAVPYSPAAINGTSVSSPLTADWPQGSIADDPIAGGGSGEGGPMSGTLADSGSTPGGDGTPALTAPYPGRAASLPGSIHYPQSTRSRSAMPSSSTSAAREGTAGQGYTSNPSSSSSSSTTTTASTRLRDNPQLRAQIAQQVANGTLPAAMLSHHQQHQPQQHHPTISYERYTAELTNCIIAFLSPMLPTEEEYRMKEATRRQLERLTGKVSPGAKLLAFGSMANGFALRNSDMDLCCLIASQASAEANDGKDAQPQPQSLSASELVERLAEVIRAETDYKVLPLPKARIPIIKLSRASTSEFPYEISCDIGFENRLALENTRLLLSYAMVDPPRLRTLVLFLKVWTKRRKLNTPFMGTLSSYGYTLLVLFFLCHVKRPAVLPNLQRIPPTRSLAPDEVQLNGHNIYFYDDMATLRNEWQSQNQENVAELLIDFFRYFAKDFVYSRDVVSLRTEGGLIPKDGGIWSAELCIEDPFQLGYNVSRTVTKDGLYTIRGEFMRAMRILQNRGQRVSAQLAELCEEREDIVARAPDTPPARHRYMPASHHQPYYVDARTMRELYYDAMPPRRTSHHVQPSGHGGSFAFEEMARGLGRQRSQMAYPSQAMLAPLSQQGGLSPKTPHRVPPTPDATTLNGSAKGASAGGAARATGKGSSSLRHQQRVDDGEGDGEGEKESQAESGQDDEGSPGGASSSRQSSALDAEDDDASSVSTATTATGAGVEAHQRVEQGSVTGQAAAEEKGETRPARFKQQQASTPPLAARPPAAAHQRRSSSPSSSKRRTSTLPGPSDADRHHHNPAAAPLHASARTSPNLNPTVPPHSVVAAANLGDGQGGRANDDVGEAWAFGSEIVFGSERFRLHPHPHHHHYHHHQHHYQHQQQQQQQQQTHRRQTSAEGVASGSEKLGSPSLARDDDAAPTSPPASAHRSSRALSDGGGVNRSMSLPPRRLFPASTRKPALPPSEAGGSEDEDAGAAPATESIDDFRSISGASASVHSLAAGDGGDAPSKTEVSEPASSGQDGAAEGEANGQPPMAEYTAEWAQKQFQQQQEQAGAGAGEVKEEAEDKGDETIVLPPMPPQSPPRLQQAGKQATKQAKQRKASTSSSVASSSASRPHANGKASHA